MHSQERRSPRRRLHSCAAPPVCSAARRNRRGKTEGAGRSRRPTDHFMRTAVSPRSQEAYQERRVRAPDDGAVPAVAERRRQEAVERDDDEQQPGRRERRRGRRHGGNHPPAVVVVVVVAQPPRAHALLLRTPLPSSTRACVRVDAARAHGQQTPLPLARAPTARQRRRPALLPLFRQHVLAFAGEDATRRRNH
jgi:hypothetical protein